VRMWEGKPMTLRWRPCRCCHCPGRCCSDQHRCCPPRCPGSRGDSGCGREFDLGRNRDGRGKRSRGEGVCVCGGGGGGITPVWGRWLPLLAVGTEPVHK
jgi:hypothetical protein